MLGYLASFPRSSPQHEDIFKSCKDVMPLLSYLLFKDASFPVLKCTVTIGGHMQDLRDCPMSLLIELWYTPIISWTQEQVSTLKRLNPVGVNSNLAKSVGRDSEGRTYRHTLTKECGVSGEEAAIVLSCEIFWQLSHCIFPLITQC